MRLDDYTACSRAQSRALLQSFWSRSSQPDPLVATASLQYGPIALAMMVVTTCELAALAAGLGIHHHPHWAIVALAFTLCSAWSSWWAWRCVRWAQHNEAILRRFG